MRTFLQRRWLPVVGLVIALAPLGGCNILGLAYFTAIFFGMDTRLPAKFNFPEETGRIAVVTAAELGTQLELGPLDRDLNDLVARKLFEGFDGDKKLKKQYPDFKVVKASTVSKWQDEHPNWRLLEPAEIGRALEAQYVILLEVENVDLYEDGPSRHLYHGRIEVGISVIKVDDDQGEVVFPKDSLFFEYPKDRPIPAADLSLARFRREFLTRLAEQIVHYFVPREQNYNPGADRF